MLLESLFIPAFGLYSYITPTSIPAPAPSTKSNLPPKGLIRVRMFPAEVSKRAFIWLMVICVGLSMVKEMSSAPRCPTPIPNNNLEVRPHLQECRFEVLLKPEKVIYHS